MENENLDDAENVDSFFLPGGILDTDTERPAQTGGGADLDLLDLDLGGLDLGLAAGVGSRHTRASTSRFVSSETPRTGQQHASQSSFEGEENDHLWMLEGINPNAPEFTPSLPNQGNENLPDFFQDRNDESDP
ncbi:unnamed protein product, partial [Heterosigma akashiwo]